MADAVPVCDVLREAMEYLSKLGVNLKSRVDNLREKKIRRDTLKNAHAVQKTANKVLLICELSKKSIENVETGVKDLLQQIQSTQGFGCYSGKKTCYESDCNETFEYFEYESKQLKIRKKIFLQHYISVKVVAEAIPLNVLENYPVYYDCSLYQLKKNHERDRKNNKEVNDKNEDATKTEGLAGNCDIIGNPPTIIEVMDMSTMEPENKNNDIVGINCTTNVDTNLNSNKQIDLFTTLSPKTFVVFDENVNMNDVASNVTKENDYRTQKNDDLIKTELNLADKNEDEPQVIKHLKNKKNQNEDKSKKKKIKYKHIKILDDSSNTSTDENDSLVFNSDQGGTKLNNENETDEKSNDNCSNLTITSNDVDPNTNVKEKDISSDSTETKRTFIKCVNINKLLEAPKKKKDDTDCNIENGTVISKLNTLQPLKKTYAKNIMKVKKNCEMSNKTRKLLENNGGSDDTDHTYWEAKRNEIKLFKSKEFHVHLCRLPNFSVNFLKKHDLKTITRSGSIVFQLKTCPDIQTEAEKTNPDNLILEHTLNDCVDDNLKQIDHCSPPSTDIQMVESSLKNDVNSAEPFENDILKVAESIKNALLNDSNSDRESDKEKEEILHIGSTTEKNESNNKLCNLAEQNECIEKAENVTLPSDDISNSSPKKSLYSDLNEDPDKIKMLLLNDSSDGSSNTREKDNNKEQINEDLEKVNTSLLNDCSESTPLKTQKRKRESDIDSSSKSKRRQIMESMHAKKMLLTYSSSSDTDDESLRNVLKEIKDSLLKGNTSDEGDDKTIKKSNNTPILDSENDVPILKNNLNKTSSCSSGDENDIETLNIKKNRKCLRKNSGKEESSSKMGGSKTNQGSRSSQNSDSQDANDKDIDGLTNLKTLSKSHRRHRSSTEESAAAAETKETEPKEMSKVPRFKADECLLKAETSSDATSLAESEEGEDVKDIPTVSMSALNGDGISHLAKDDLLQDSDSLSSHEDKSQEDIKKSDTEIEDNIKTKRRKGNAISSDSEAGSSRRRERGRKISDFEDSDDEGSESAGNKKRKNKPAESDDNSSVDSSKKKRRRIKDIDDSDGSDSDTENEGRNKHGRKNIRKVMGKNQLEEATKKAAREEKERIARIAERQKVYNNLEFDESGKPDEVILEKVVLDFDPETKEPLIEVDRGLVKKLKPHQANGIKFMWDACFESVKRIKKDKGSGCILAHCMGLGKTLQVVSLTHTLLTHSELTGVNRVLVVCPLSTVLNWVNEFRIWLKHTEKEYDVDVYELSRYKQNSERAFQLQHWLQNGGVCVLGYEMFRNLSADNPKKFKKKMLKNFQESLVDPGPDLVVCDEGHLLKNEKTSLSQSMNRVKTLRRIVLTGTPLQNNLKEYYCMVQFVKPNLLGKYNEYLNRFVNPITNGQYTDSTEHDIRVMKRRSHVLHKMLDGAVQRRDYGVLAPFLPPKHEYVLFITLTEVQIKLYQHYLDNYSRRPLPGKSSGFLFPDFQSLQRIWTHPLVLKYNSERYEIMQQKKREREEEDSEGSLVDFIDDDSTPEESTTEESSDEYSDVSDDSRKKSKKKKSTKKGKVKDNKVTTRRGTRANPVEQLEDDVKPLEALETKYENPTEWWIKLMSDDELEDMRNSHKLVLLFDILRQCETIGDKLLVFSQSLYSLDLIEHFLGKVDEASQEGRIDEKLGGHVGSWSPGLDYFRLDGSTSCENRSIWCKNFNKEDNPRARLFLISTRAGGLGINLVAANRVVIFDVSWNPSHDVQSIFRVYRFGQKKPCYIYRFLAMGTMEEKIYERQVTKQAISKRVIDEQQIDRHYAENDLAELYKFSPRPPTPRPLPSLPRDRLFAEMLREHDALIYKYHEHDSLLENKEEETLSEEERKAAWEDFENEKNRPPPAPFPAAWQMPNGMVPGLLAQQQQQLTFAALGAMLRKDMPNITDNQIREMLPLLYNSNPGMFGGYDYGLIQKLNDVYKYAQPGMMNAGMMNPVMTPGGGGTGSLGGTSGLQYEPPWLRQHNQQQQMRLQQMLQQQHQNMGAKYYAGGLGSRDPVAMALQQQRAREIMLGERGRPRGRPPLHRTPPASDIVNLADSD